MNARVPPSGHCKPRPLSHPEFIYSVILFSFTPFVCSFIHSEYNVTLKIISSLSQPMTLRKLLNDIKVIKQLLRTYLFSHRTLEFGFLQKNITYPFLNFSTSLLWFQTLLEYFDKPVPFSSCPGAVFYTIRQSPLFP